MNVFVQSKGELETERNPALHLVLASMEAYVGVSSSVIVSLAGRPIILAHQKPEFKDRVLFTKEVLSSWLRPHLVMLVMFLLSMSRTASWDRVQSVLLK